jgi:hypothetical protein
MSSMGALGFVLLGAKTRSARAVAKVLAFLLLEIWKAERSPGRPGGRAREERSARER